MLSKLLKSDFKILSEIARDIAQVFFATAVISQLIAGIDKGNWLVVALGSVISIVLWGFSLAIGRMANYE
jgi:hypothetical protein